VAAIAHTAARPLVASQHAVTRPKHGASIVVIAARANSNALTKGTATDARVQPIWRD